MKTFVLLFSVDAYEREELTKLTGQELYNLASVDACTGYGDVCVMSLNEFSESVNDGEITSLERSWLYFVETNE